VIGRWARAKMPTAVSLGQWKAARRLLGARRCDQPSGQAAGRGLVGPRVHGAARAKLRRPRREELDTALWCAAHGGPGREHRRSCCLDRRRGTPPLDRARQPHRRAGPPSRLADLRRARPRPAQGHRSHTPGDGGRRQGTGLAQLTQLRDVCASWRRSRDTRRGLVMTRKRARAPLSGSPRCPGGASLAFGRRARRRGNRKVHCARLLAHGRRALAGRRRLKIRDVRGRRAAAAMAAMAPRRRCMVDLEGQAAACRPRRACADASRMSEVPRAPAGPRRARASPPGRARRCSRARAATARARVHALPIG
jgi:hypothetical protein